jgi:nitrate/TMAO reductase-like tetraheme cytochrome c subunit
MEQTMKPLRFAAVGVLGLVVSFYSLGDSWSQATNGENHCFTCHTNARKLIEITREIAKARKGKQVKSAAIHGEG